MSGVTSTDVSSLSPEKSVVTTPGRSTSGSSSLLSFEQHERSLLGPDTPQTARRPLKNVDLIVAGGSPLRDGDKCTKAGKDTKAVGVRFLLPANETHQSGTMNSMQGIWFSHMVLYASMVYTSFVC